jgi:hypothetical protein
MNNHTIFNLKYWVTIWQGAALILNIDPSEVIDKPTWHSEEQIYGIGEVFGDENNMPYFSPDKTDLVYQETMNLLIDGCCEWDGWFTVRGSKINPDILTEIVQSTEIKTSELKEWAISKGFKSEFLGNLVLEKETSTNTESKKPNNLERTNEARKLNDETLKETVELFREVRKNNPKWLQGSVLSAVAEQITSVNTGAGVKRRLNKAIEHGFIELSELNF